MGGGFVLVLAAQQGDKIGAAVPFYGVLGGLPGPSGLSAPLLGHFGEEDELAPPEAARALAERIENESGVHPDFRFYPAGHAFFNDENLLGTYDPEQALKAWSATRGLPALASALRFPLLLTRAARPAGLRRRRTTPRPPCPAATTRRRSRPAPSRRLPDPAPTKPIPDSANTQRIGTRTSVPEPSPVTVRTTWSSSAADRRPLGSPARTAATPRSASGALGGRDVTHDLPPPVRAQGRQRAAPPVVDRRARLHRLPPPRRRARPAGRTPRR